MHRDGEFVMRSVGERGVRVVRLWFVDVLGLPKSFSIPVSELESALEEGVSLDGSSLEGSARGAERDVIAHPDPQTFQVLPWSADSGVARMFCDVCQPDGAPFPGDSREALRRVMARAGELGLSLQVGPEIEFFLFAEPVVGEEPRPLDEGAYFDLTPLDVFSGFRGRTMDYLERMSIPVKASHHEVGASQHELDLLHTDAMSMAEAMVTFRLAVKEVARELGLHATFMPKPLDDQAGSGLHLHLSLFGAQGNAFHDPSSEQQLSELGRRFLAGLVHHADEICAVTNQWINSYARLRTGFEAPAGVGWARHGAPLVRVPSNRPGKEAAARIELRLPDPACNPFLAFALVLAAGLRGVEGEYELPPETGDEGMRSLPGDLREALDRFEASELVRDTLDERLRGWFLRNKRAEWDRYQATVSGAERDRLLRAL